MEEREHSDALWEMERKKETAMHNKPQHKNKRTIIHRLQKIACFLFLIGMLNPMKVKAETVGLPIYIETTQAHVVYVGPSTEYAPMGILEKDTIAIVYALTDNYWYQIYYKGNVGYISHDNVRLYNGGDGSVTGTKLNLQGKQVIMNMLGDSVTAGEKLSSQSQTYAALLGNKMGATVRNYGLGGSAVAGNHPDRFLDRYVAMDPNANVIFVFGGTNDWGFDTALGTFGDRHQETFYGGLNQLMCGLQQMYPSADIVFLTPLRRENDGKKNAYGNTLNQYAQAVIDMAGFYNFRVLDLYTPANLNFASQKSVYMKDGIHPSARAHSILADYIYQQLVTGA
ncbi:MAG: GDSL-type esterase/lipase family protein [Lachnospiraceae bacterium]|nr:GDSL-type esterase/lipase family protein [Lachnospiraceae bacterium]